MIFGTHVQLGAGEADKCVTKVQNGNVADIRSLLDAAIRLADVGAELADNETDRARFSETADLLRGLRGQGDNATANSSAQAIWGTSAQVMCELIEALLRFAPTIPGFPSRLTIAFQGVNAQLARAPTPPTVDFEPLDPFAEDVTLPTPEPRLLVPTKKFPTAAVIAIGVGVLIFAAIGIQHFSAGPKRA